MKLIRSKPVKTLLAVLFWLALWQLLSVAVGSALLLPAPLAVVQRLFELMGTAEFWYTVLLSLLRISAGIVSALVLGVITAVLTSRFALLERAKVRGWERDREAVAAFESENSRWLPDYALYMAVKRHFDEKPWTQWPDEAIRLLKPEAMAQYRQMLASDICMFTYSQFLFFRQWNALREYAHEQGVGIIGDLPI